MTNEYDRLAKLINDAGGLLTENIFGPGDKRKSGGVARGGQISQSKNNRSAGTNGRRTGTNGRTGVGGAQIEPQAKSGEPNKDEDELEKDYLEMDDEPLEPQSPLGKLIAKEFDQEPTGDEESGEEPTTGDEKDDEKSGEVEEEAISMQGKRKIGGPYQTKNQRYTGILFTFAQKGGSISWQGRGQGGPGARGLLVVRDNKTGQSVDKRFPSPERAAKAWRNLAKINLHEAVEPERKFVTSFVTRDSRFRGRIEKDPGMAGRAYLIVVDQGTGQTTKTPFKGVSQAKAAWAKIDKLHEDYQGNDQTVTDKDGKPLDVDEDAYETAQKTEPTEVQQMDEPFTVQTKEGPAEGNAGDYLAKGVDGEQWPIDQDIFDRTHEFVNEGKPWAVVAVEKRGSTRKGQVLSKHKTQGGARKSSYEYESQAGIPSEVKHTPGSKVHDIIHDFVDPEIQIGTVGLAGTESVDEARSGSYYGGISPIKDQPFGPFKGPGSNSSAGSSGGASEDLDFFGIKPDINDSKKQAKMREGRTAGRGEIVQVRADLWASTNIIGEIKHFTSRKIAVMFANTKRNAGRVRGEAVGGKWVSSTNHFKPEGDHEAKTMARGMVQVQVREEPDHLSSGGGTSSGSDRASTFRGKENLSPEEMKVIDDNWKQILKVSSTLFKQKPHPVALRAIEKYLEKLGVDESHSMKIGAIIAKQFERDTDPTSMIIPKVIPKIQQEPYMRGSGYTVGGSGGLGPTR